LKYLPIPFGGKKKVKGRREKEEIVKGKGEKIKDNRGKLKE
jgi:hypothetical protein